MNQIIALCLLFAAYLPLHSAAFSTTILALSAASHSKFTNLSSQSAEKGGDMLSYIHLHIVSTILQVTT
jgi:hypothetical protein